MLQVHGGFLTFDYIAPHFIVKMLQVHGGFNGYFVKMSIVQKRNGKDYLNGDRMYYIT